MIESHLNDWLLLVLRWSHLIVGIAWIGASFYFNWLENRLERGMSTDPLVEGSLWAVHGGGFYHVKKFRVTPGELPTTLHWFKWEAYATWLTGLALLVLIYYVDAQVFLVDASVAEISPLVGIVIGVVSIMGTWIIYDVLCRSSLRNQQKLLGIVIFIYFSVLAFVLCQLFSGRGAFIHVGAAIGTVMVLNVMAVIIPSQRALVEAMTSGSQPDASKGAAALTRSRHNNYLTLPVLFIMIANHYPMTFASKWNWLILVAISVAGVVVRHYFNVRHLPGNRWWLLMVGLGLLVGVAVSTMPQVTTPPSQVAVNFDEMRKVVHEKCTVCHSKAPVQQGFTAPPLGLVLDTDEQITEHAARIFSATVVTRTMPIANLSNMTEEERQIIAQWYSSYLRNSK